MSARVKYTEAAAARLPGREHWRGTAQAVAINSAFKLVLFDGQRAPVYVLASKLEPAEPFTA